MERVAHVHEEAIVAAELLGDLLRFVDEAFALAERIGSAEQVGDGSSGDVVRAVTLRTSGRGGLLTRLALFIGHPDIELGLQLIALVEVGLEVGQRVILELRADLHVERVGLVMIIAMLIQESLLDGVIDLGRLRGFATLGSGSSGSGLGVLGRSDGSGALLGGLRGRSRSRLGGLDRSGGLALRGRSLGRRLGDDLGRGLSGRLGLGLRRRGGFLGGLLRIGFLGHR